MVQKLKCIYTCYENIDWLLDKTARLFGPLYFYLFGL